MLFLCLLVIFCIYPIMSILLFKFTFKIKNRKFFSRLFEANSYGLSFGLFKIFCGYMS